MEAEVKEYRIPTFVGGARKTCKVKPEGFSKFARELAEYYVKERSDRLLAAIKGNREGYLMKTGREYVTFALVDNEEQLAANILAALNNYANGTLTVREARTLPQGLARMIAGM